MGVPGIGERHVQGCRVAHLRLRGELGLGGHGTLPFLFAARPAQTHIDCALAAMTDMGFLEADHKGAEFR